MPEIFDDTWSSGPFGPGVFLLISQTTGVSDYSYVLGGIAGSEVFHIPGAIVQYGTATMESPPIFRRTLTRRVGSREVIQ